MNKIFITDSIEEAIFCEKVGIQSVMIDLEINGKDERQKNKDSRISTHDKKNISRISKKLNKTKIIVRINPIYQGTYEEVNYACESGADYIMLPMFKSLFEVKEALKYLKGKTKLIPLFETLASVKISREVLDINEIQEFYIGLNDLHLELKKNFMFSVITDDLINKILNNNIKKKKFGIGGIGPIINNINLQLDPKEILKIHKYYNSNTVILSRSFNSIIDDNNSFINSIKLIDAYWKNLDRVENFEIDQIFKKIKLIENSYVKKSS
tara:strand:+ start:802 stop:1605 length:804 start_codon:yes stop_codon:yes gene_type:complete